MSNFSRIIFLVTIIAAAGLIGFTFWGQKGTGPMVKTSGKALVGGPFTLINHDGKTVTEKDFMGKYMLVYFGYTFCPDICPTELQVISAALEQMGKAADNIQPVFVSVDPERDTPQVLKDYVSNFHPRMVGLTGTKEQISAAARAYRVYYAKVKEKGAENDDDYLMDHSSITYLMGPDGQFVKHFSYGTDATKVAKGITAALAK